MAISKFLDHGTRPFIVEDRLPNIDGSLDRLNACDHGPKLFKRMFRIDQWCECFELTRWAYSFLPTPFSINEITNLIFNLYFLYYLKHIDVYIYAISSQISNLLRPRCLEVKNKLPKSISTIQNTDFFNWELALTLSISIV